MSPLRSLAQVISAMTGMTAVRRRRRVLPWAERLESRELLSGNTPALAGNLGTVLDRVQLVNDSINGADPVDYWKFIAAGDGTTSLGLDPSGKQSAQTTIRLTGLTGDLNFQIEDSTGKVLGTSTRLGTFDEILVLSLKAPQTYYVKVFGVTPVAASNYQLSIDTRNDARTTPTNLGTINLNDRVVNGKLSANDPFDFFRFTISDEKDGITRRDMLFLLEGLQQDVDFALYNETGSLIASGTRGGTQAEFININLNVGDTYLLKVAPARPGSTSTYRLTLASVTDLGTLTTTAGATGTVGGADTVDVFKFTVGGQTRKRFRLDSLLQNADIALYDATGRLLGAGIKAGTLTEQFDITLVLGATYYLKVIPKAGATPYRLNLSTV